ncbi:MAG: 2-oxoglutarate and iron-dependent oxygenase domain-containing protein, partial [Pseudomonadota bacterium]|nr:2-oxoglutarate and iron-dependent oxygenase domain-containing protein [Pseudomonadota bacterium]
MGSVRGQHLDCPVEIASLPIIDLESFVEGGAATKQQISQATVDACESAGFFYVSGHGIEEQVFE